jgi:hypothetical protein
VAQPEHFPRLKSDPISACQRWNTRKNLHLCRVSSHALHVGVSLSRDSHSHLRSYAERSPIPCLTCPQASQKTQRIKREAVYSNATIPKKSAPRPKELAAVLLAAPVKVAGAASVEVWAPAAAAGVSGDGAAAGGEAGGLAGGATTPAALLDAAEGGAAAGGAPEGGAPAGGAPAGGGGIGRAAAAS